MNKLNWRNAKKELPDAYVKCVVFIKNGNIDIDSVKTTGKFSRYGDLVINWFYMYELPLPEE